MSEQYLMNPYTGTVQTLEEWQEDFESMSSEEWGGKYFEDAGLVPVHKNEDGDWVEDTNRDEY